MKRREYIKVNVVGGPDALRRRASEEVRTLERDVCALVTKLKESGLRCLGLSDDEVRAGLQILNETIPALAASMGEIVKGMTEFDGNQKRALTDIEEAYTRFLRICEVLTSPIAREIDTRTRRCEVQEPDKGHVAVKAFRGIVVRLMSTTNASTARTSIDLTDPVAQANARTILDRRNRETLELLNLSGLKDIMNELGSYTDTEMIGQMNRFMTNFLRIAREFTDVREWEKAACFKAMCYAHARKNVDVLSIYDAEHQNPSCLEVGIVTNEVLGCPPILFFEIPTLEAIKEVVGKIRDDKTARAIIENPRWVDPARFTELEELIVLMDRFVSNRKYNALEILKGSSLSDALKALKKLEEHQGYLELYSSLAIKLPREFFENLRFADYVSEVAGEVDSSTGETFHETLMQIEPHVHHTVVAFAIMHALEVFLSGKWGEVALLFLNRDQSPGAEALKAIGAGDIETATAIIDGEQERRRIEVELSIDARIRRTFQGIGDEQLGQFREIYIRLGSLGISESRFVSLRKHGMETLYAVAEASAQLSNSAIMTIFRSDELRGLFAKSVGNSDTDGLFDRINILAANEGTECTIAELLQTHIDMNEQVGQGQIRRIVLVAGETVISSIQTGLQEQTEKELRAVSGAEATYRYLSGLVKEGDIVVVAVSHLSHSASGNAISLCRGRGVPFVVCGCTNAERIANRINRQTT